MVSTRRVVVAGDPDDLFCDTCSNRYASRGSTERTIESARVAGWHVYTGPSRVPLRDYVIKPLCPDCVGTPRTQAVRVEVMPGQTDMLTELNFTITPVVKGKRGKGKGREMS